jgi:hypothetical protein
MRALVKASDSEEVESKRRRRSLRHVDVAGNARKEGYIQGHSQREMHTSYPLSDHQGTIMDACMSGGERTCSARTSAAAFGT